MPYMRHPNHGCTSVPGDAHTIGVMQKDGWELFDPAAKAAKSEPVKEPVKVEVPVLVEEPAKKRGRPRKE